MVSRYSMYPREVLPKVSSRSNIWKFVKNPTILQVTSWSLGGKGYSWQTWRWCQGTQDIPGKFYWKFHQDPTSGSLSRLCLSSKSLPGVLDERDVLDGAGDGVMVLKISQGGFTESFIKIHHKEACKDYKYHQSLFLESWGTWRFLMDLEMVEGGLVYP